MKSIFYIYYSLTLLICVKAQFGEIASIVGSVLGSGAGLGSAAGAAGVAGAGATGALANIGQLYQLAQTALSLTGTGVGILNQASESSWFPAAVEQAVKSNRDFQEKLLAAQSKNGLPIEGGLGGLTLPGMTKSTPEPLGKEYGKNFETDSGEESSTKSPSLEKELEELEKEEKVTQPFIGKATVEEVDEFGRPIEKLEGLTGPLPTPAPLVAGPKVTVEIPANLKTTDIKDYEDLLGKMWPGNPDSSGVGFSTDGAEENGVSKMVPELQKLLRDLKMSNLSKSEFQEIVKQLESNHEDNIGQPRENTTPVTPPKSSELGSEEQEPSPEAKEKKTMKNLPALRRILASQEDVTTTEATTITFPSTTSSPRIWTRTAATRPGFIPELVTTVQPKAKAVGTTHRVDSDTNGRAFSVPRAVPTVVVPRPVAKGVVQQRFYPNQAQPNPYHTAQKVQAPTYPQRPPQTWTEYHQQYQEYLRKYYPAYVQSYYPTSTAAQAHGQRIYPVRRVPQVVPTTPPSWLAHPYGQGTLLTNQQPSQYQMFGKK